MAPDDSSEPGSAGRNEPILISFVIRLWLEDMPLGSRRRWRGQIMLVDPLGAVSHTTTERRTFDDLDHMMVFVASHLEQRGARLPWHWHVRRALSGKRFLRLIGLNGR